jgi:hypothetical protein
MTSVVRFTDKGGRGAEARLENGVWACTEPLTEVYLDVVTALWRAAQGDHVEQAGACCGRELALASYCAALLGGTVVTDCGRDGWDRRCLSHSPRAATAH